MAYSNGIITRPVLVTPSGGDVGQALGLSRNNIGSLIADGNINPWAKYKPVRGATLDKTGESSGSAWWKGADEQCGFSIPYNTSPGSAPGTSSGAWYKLLHSQLMWEYLKPQGGIGSQPYRTLDFDGYDHNAQPIFAEPQSLTLMVGYDDSLAIPFEQNEGNSRWLGLGDIKVNSTYLSSWYFGALIYDTNSHYTFKATQLASAAGGMVTFSGMASYAGKSVQVVPFFSSVAQQQGTASNGRILSCNLAPVQMDIVAYSSGINVIWNEATWNSALTKVSYDIELYNSSATSKTVTNIVIILRDNTQTLNTRTISSVSVPAGQTVTLATGSFNATYDSSKEYYLGIGTQGSTMIPYEEIQVEENPDIGI